jgi:phenylalanyl-tRNA synthetase beta chain
VNLREDVAEEIARVMGYDRLPSRVPALTTPPQGKWNLDSEQSRAGLIDAWKDAWVSLGFQESLNFGFTSESWLKTLGLIEPASTEGKHWIRVLNPLSEEHAVMVPSLLPGLLRNAIDQWRHHFGSEPSPVRLFEIRPTFFKPTPGPLQALDESRTGAQEVWKVSFLVSGPVLSSGLRTDLREVDFFDLKGAVESWLEAIGARGIRMREASATGLSSFFHPTQSVEILAGRSSAGWFGALHPELALKLKVRSPLYLGEFEVGALSEVSRKVTDSPAFRAWSEFPGMERDFAVLIREGVRADQVVASIQKSGKPLVHSVKVFDIYRGAQIQAGMTSLAVRVIFQGEGRVLQEVETEEVSRKIVDALKQDLGAELR